ncbi:hypothetical protein R3P38DRAFT_2875613 [Favolaschia claudopus]|uniref:Secreted protein n=1 Tax=Favolaschia claudopus TaxID=2862362 RepID=A0AAW0D6M4_9AGAR
MRPAPVPLICNLRVILASVSFSGVCRNVAHPFCCKICIVSSDVLQTYIRVFEVSGSLTQQIDRCAYVMHKIWRRLLGVHATRWRQIEKIFEFDRNAVATS